MGGDSQGTSQGRTSPDTDATNGYLKRLRRELVQTLSEDELRTLCTRLGVDYDQLPGQDKVSKVDALVSSGWRAGFIHAIVEQYAELRGSTRWGAVMETPSRSGPGPSSRVTKHRKDIEHRWGKLEQKKEFLRQFFGKEPIALEEDLCKSWEFLVTRVIHKLNSQMVKRGITRLSHDVASIGFIRDMESKAPEQSTPSLPKSSAEPREPESERRDPVPDPAFVNYHSVCCWYREIRSGAKLLLAPFVIVGLLLLILMAAYTAGGVLVLSGVEDISYVADEGNPGLVYTAPETGTYYVEVRDTTPGDRRYYFGVTSLSSEVVIPDFSQTNVWHLGSGEQIFSRIQYAQQHVYCIESSTEQTIWVDIYRWYTDADLSFTLLDPEKRECGTASLLMADSVSMHEYLTHEVSSSGPHFLRVQIAEEQSDHTLRLSSGYGFQVYKVLDYTEKEPNDDFESSTKISPGWMVSGDLGNSDRDYYSFDAQAGQQVQIIAKNLSDSSLSCVTLYRLTEKGPEVAAHSTRSVPPSPEINRRLFETSRGRAYAVSSLLNSLGLNTSPANFMGSAWRIWTIYLPVLLFAILCIGYALLVMYLSERKYEESAAIRHIVNVLCKLRQDDALRSESRKSNIRLNINMAAERTRKIHRTSSFAAMYAAPKDMEVHMAKIASRIRETNTIVSTPHVWTLSSLRHRFVEWLNVFLKAEYGWFQFDESYKPVPLPWHQSIGHTIQRHWKKILSLSIVGLLTTFLTQPLWIDHWIEIATSVWLSIRYLALIVAVYAIYNRWGPRGPGEKPAFKWENTVRLILFFFVPLFGLDAVLQTGIVEHIVELVSSLKIF